MAKIIPLVFLVAGAVILGLVFTPIVKYKIQEVALIKDSLALTSPQSVKSGVLGVSIQNSSGDFPLFISYAKRETPKLYDSFQISIPSIDIQNESVMVDSNDINSGLIHLPGTALPGEKGNVFVTGHSALPFLVKSTKKAVFAALPDVEKGDKINVIADGVALDYEVYAIKVVDPTDVSVINPPDQMGRFITLMTCVPPGLNTKRLIVIGKLI